FYATLHDTTQDRALFFEEDLESKSLPASHLQFKSIFRKALDYNAKERSRRLDLVPKDTVIPRAAEMMAKRAYSIFEPRPELNHATNAAAIVGRRELTRGLFLDRRSFLQSYDPFSDPNGNILEGILGAVIPVCGGINLEYFFSRVDNEVYGAGTKLSHNVVGLMGVANGVNNDLIPGLPLQMIEAHDPVRLLILIDQEPEIIKMVLQKNHFLYEWVNHHWVRLASFSPTQKNISMWTRDGWSLLNMENSLPPPIINNDPMVLAQKSENLSLGFIDTTKTLGVSK
ncbi:MAG: putative inorganic carbon transporter subunit DabA, partial [Deltaproteobacteria bacterium]